MKKLYVLLVVAALIGLQFTVSTHMAHAAEYIDGDNEPVTARNGMHTCPIGWFMVGAHIGLNDFLCSNEFGSYTRSSEIVDGNVHPTIRFGMHACPTGYAMTGYHFGLNLLSCARLRNPGGSVVLTYDVNGDNEPVTVRGGMHACPRGQAMAGIDVSKNHFICLRYGPVT
jgi:hypothetical protein